MKRGPSMRVRGKTGGAGSTSRRLTWIVFTGLTASCGPGAAAQDAGSDERPPGERAALTGDWGGHRSALAERGVDIGLVAYNDAVSVVHGGLDPGTFYPGLVEPTVALDLGRLLGWDGTVLYFRGVGMYGRDPVEATGSLDAPSHIASDAQTFRLYDAWIERSFLDQALSVRAGLYGADAEFDVKEVAGIFMNGGFGTGIDLAQSGPNGPCIYANSCLGIRVKYRPTPWHYLQLAVLNGVAGDPEDPYGTHVLLDGSYGALLMGEAGFVRSAEEGRFLRLAIGTWYYTAASDDVLDVNAEGDPARSHGRPGVYALAEGGLYRESPEGVEGLNAFLRVGTADPDVNQVEYYAAGGIAYTGLLRGRDEDIAALGISAPINGDEFKRAQRLAGNPVDNAEVALECTYWMPIVPWFSLQLAAQYIVNPGTDPNVEDALVLGLRTKFVF